MFGFSFFVVRTAYARTHTSTRVIPYYNVTVQYT